MAMEQRRLWMIGFVEFLEGNGIVAITVERFLKKCLVQCKYRPDAIAAKAPAFSYSSSSSSSHHRFFSLFFLAFCNPLPPASAMATANPATLKNLRIKSGSCKRLLKELHAYEKEVQHESAKTSRMKDEGADPYDLKQQESVLAESRMMIPDCTKRLEASLGDLQAAVEDAEKELTQGSEEIEDAKRLITEAEASIDHQSA